MLMKYEPTGHGELMMCHGDGVPGSNGEPDEHELPDEQLWDAYRDGDENAAAVLFERYHTRVMGLARRKMGGILRETEDPSDLVQSVFRSVFLRGRDCQIQIGPRDSLWPLLATVTVNKSRNLAKHWGRQCRDPRRRIPLEGRDPSEPGLQPDDAICLQEAKEQLLAPFSRRRREIIEDLLAGESVAEIARRRRTSETTIYNTRQAAIQVIERMQADE